MGHLARIDPGAPPAGVPPTGTPLPCRLIGRPCAHSASSFWSLDHSIARVLDCFRRSTAAGLMSVP